MGICASKEDVEAAGAETETDAGALNAHNDAPASSTFHNTSVATTTTTTPLESGGDERVTGSVAPQEVHRWLTPHPESIAESIREKELVEDGTFSFCDRKFFCQFTELDLPERHRCSRILAKAPTNNPNITTIAAVYSFLDDIFVLTLADCITSLQLCGVRVLKLDGNHCSTGAVEHLANAIASTGPKSSFEEIWLRDQSSGLMDSNVAASICRAFQRCQRLKIFAVDFERQEDANRVLHFMRLRHRLIQS